MHFQALACDYDGTLAHNGVVAPEVVSELIRLKDSGRRIILVTGRQLPDLLAVFPMASVFDRIVAENGAVLFDPASRELRALAPPPPAEFVDRLKERVDVDVSVGHVIVATWTPAEVEVLETIREMGLEMQVIFNKGAVMVLPSGVNKATGLEYTLRELGLSEHNTVAVGDAENDHAMFSLCECSVAVANALPQVKRHADFVTTGDHGDGVRELIFLMLEDDLRSKRRDVGRHLLTIGHTASGHGVTIDPNDKTILICGPSGSGKTMLALAMVEQLNAHHYQYCLLDPERDFDELSGAVVFGESRRAPSVHEIMQGLTDPTVNVVVTLLGVPHTDRPNFFSRLIPQLQEMRSVYGRPHWIVADEAHYLMPIKGQQASDNGHAPLSNVLLITVHPHHLSSPLLRSVDVVIVTANSREETLEQFCKASGERLPPIDLLHANPDDYVIWDRGCGKLPTAFTPIRPRQEHHRHLRKYAEGDLGAYHSFYFTGPLHRMNLKAQNLQMFTQLADGIDDDTWLFHLRRHDYSRWFRGSIRDDGLANAVIQIEDDQSLSPLQSKSQVRAEIESRYSAPV